MARAPDHGSTGRRPLPWWQGLCRTGALRGSSRALRARGSRLELGASCSDAAVAAAWQAAVAVAAPLMTPCTSLPRLPPVLHRELGDGTRVARLQPGMGGERLLGAGEALPWCLGPEPAAPTLLGVEHAGMETLNEEIAAEEHVGDVERWGTRPEPPVPAAGLDIAATAEVPRLLLCGARDSPSESAGGPRMCFAWVMRSCRLFSRSWRESCCSCSCGGLAARSGCGGSGCSCEPPPTAPKATAAEPGDIAAGVQPNSWQLLILAGTARPGGTCEGWGLSRGAGGCPCAEKVRGEVVLAEIFGTAILGLGDREGELATGPGGARTTRTPEARGCGGLSQCPPGDLRAASRSAAWLAFWNGALLHLLTPEPRIGYVSGAAPPGTAAWPPAAPLQATR